jgi:hypothetical protein
MSVVHPTGFRPPGAGKGIRTPSEGDYRCRKQDRGAPNGYANDGFATRLCAETRDTSSLD